VVPKLLTKEHKEESSDLQGVLGHIGPPLNGTAGLHHLKDKPMLSFNMPKTQQKSRQWTKKGQPGQIEA
jgi:hypothetical protein